ncbi:MAG: GT2 family glycosyltransferase [Arcticibacterium sp.]
MSTAVVILNFNGKNHLSTFLPSILRHTQEAVIWVVDNGSTDDSVIFIKAEYPQLKLLVLNQNKGFAEGYNQALSHIYADYYVLLNSDVEVTENWLNPLINQLESSVGVAAAQPKILSYKFKNIFEYAGAGGGFLDMLGYPFCRGRMFDSCEEDMGQYDISTPVFWGTGACLAIKSTVYHEVGGLDAGFFAHMEEIDLCWRIQSSGYNIIYEPASTVYHLGGGTLHKSNPRKTFLNYRNCLAMMFKNLPVFIAIPTIFLRLILDGVSGVKLLVEGNVKDFLAILRAHFSFYAMIPYLYKKSKGVPRSKAGLYRGSVVWQYFIKGVKKYSDLPDA